MDCPQQANLEKDPLDGRRVYKTWIPTAAGHLSFFNIGKGGSQNDPVHIHIKSFPNDGKLFILVRNLRITSDRPGYRTCPFPIVGGIAKLLPTRLHLFRLKWRAIWQKQFGENYFLAVAVRENDAKARHDSLCGFVCVVPPFLVLKDYDKYWSPELNTAFVEAVREFNNDPGSPGAIQTKLDALIGSAKKFCAVKSFRFRLERNGEIIIWDDHGTSDMADGRIHEIPETDFEYQVYLFLKDIVHSHQHHDRDDDTSIGLYEITNGDQTQEIEWRRALLHSLYRRALQGEQSSERSGQTIETNELEQISQSLGFLAFARTFHALSDENPNIKDVHPKFHHDRLIDSFKARLEAFNGSHANRNQDLNFLVAFATLIFTFAGVLFAVFGDPDTPRMGSEPIHWFKQHIIIVFLLSLLFLFFVMNQGLRQRLKAWKRCRLRRRHQLDALYYSKKFTGPPPVWSLTNAVGRFLLGGTIVYLLFVLF